MLPQDSPGQGEPCPGFDAPPTLLDMDTIFDGEDAWEAKDYSAQERLDFVQQLNSQQYKKVEKFFSTMPKLSHTIEVVNPNTKEKGSVVLEGLADFFG